MDQVMARIALLRQMLPNYYLLVVGFLWLSSATLGAADQSLCFYCECDAVVIHNLPYLGCQWSTIWSQSCWSHLDVYCLRFPDPELLGSGGR